MTFTGIPYQADGPCIENGITMTTDGDTAESIALIRGHVDMVQLLKDAREGRPLRAGEGQRETDQNL